MEGSPIFMVEKVNAVKMSILFDVMHRFNAMAFKRPMLFFTEIEKQS
jgi:hypothetical protein